MHVVFEHALHKRPNVSEPTLTTKHHDHITILDGKIESPSYHIAQGMREKNEGIPEALTGFF